MGRRVEVGLLGICVAAIGVSCSDDGGGTTQNRCYCPDMAIPEVSVELPCGEQAVDVTLSGPCLEDEGGDAGTVSLRGTGTGTCSVKVTLSDGTNMTSSVTFDGDWLPCGDDPHGCGQRLQVRGAEGAGPFVLGQPCSK
jgi:hypothetical protein